MTIEQFTNTDTTKETLTYKSELSFSDFKLNTDGLIPVVVQDYQTN